MDTLTQDHPVSRAHYEGTKGRILNFLGQGLSAALVASATGVSESYISQLLADESFRQEVRLLRMAALQEQTNLDREYDTLEAELQKKLRKVLTLVSRPRDILDAIKVINGAKRRGTQDLVTDTQVSQVIEIRMPNNILQQFIKVEHNSNNQIIQAGEQSLITAQPTDIKELANDDEQRRISGSNQSKVPRSTKEVCLSDLD